MNKDEIFIVLVAAAILALIKTCEPVKADENQSHVYSEHAVYTCPTGETNDQTRNQ